MVFDKIKGMLADEERLLPRHVALTVEGNTVYARKNNIPLDQVYSGMFSNLMSILAEQVRSKIPVLTVSLLSTKLVGTKNYIALLDAIVSCFGKLSRDAFLDDNQVKLNIFGKWYDLPGEVVEAIKNARDRTMDYDRFFVNFCINYDGQEEIVDSCRIIARKVVAGKMDPEAITRDTIKENLYGSFMAPDLIIKTGKVKKLNAFLLWDSAYSKIYFSNKYWPEFDGKEFLKAIDSY